MKKIILPILAVLTCASSCMRLDNNFFNSTKLEKYSFDASPKQEITVDASYTIPANLIHQVALTSDDNGNKAKIYGIYLGDMSRIATDTVIMYFHGTRDNMDFYWSRAKLLANVGHKSRFGVFMIDYRSYGMSEGTPTESALHADAAAAIQWLKSNGLTGERLIVYGYSLGTAAATYYTANPSSLVPSKMILEAPFGSAATMVNDATTLALPPSYFTNIRVDNAETIKHIQQPFMWIHGVDDDFLAMKSHGEIVYRNYKGSWSEAHRIPGALHGDVPVVWGYENYKKAVESFIMAALH